MTEHFSSEFSVSVLLDKWLKDGLNNEHLLCYLFLKRVLGDGESDVDEYLEHLWGHSTRQKGYRKGH